jgi:hypothetical protein
MSGLLRRIRRPGAAEETRTEPTAPAPAHGSAPAAPAPREDGQRLPAGIAPEDLERRGATGRRSRLRRRARFLRRARELALRDLGGLVYEARRREQDGGKLIDDKVARLGALDAELSGIEAHLGLPRGETVIREPGVGGTCARCGELHASDANFCARCGANLEEAAREAAEKARAEEAARAERARAEETARIEAEKAEAEKAEAGAKESGGTGNGVPAAKAAESAEQPAAKTADAAERPAAKEADPAERPAPDAPTTEQPAADEPATKPLA